MKALILATGAILLSAAATASAGDPYFNGYGEQAGNFTDPYPTPGCARCGGYGGWTPFCSRQSSCPKDYLWADYCETKDCRPIYKQWCDHLSQAMDNKGRCNAGCTSCGSAGGGCASGNCGGQPEVAVQLNNPYGGWDGGKLRPVAQGNSPRLMLAPTPAGPQASDPPASSRPRRTTTLKPILPKEETTSPSDSKFLAPEGALPSPVLAAPIAPRE